MSNILNPLEGISVIRILLISSTILSFEIILILSQFLIIAFNKELSISKFNSALNLTPLRILSGSSDNVISGFVGVFIILFSKSLNPLKGSIRSPKFFSFKLTAIALIVKSLLFRSSKRVPGSTYGFLLDK